MLNQLRGAGEENLVEQELNDLQNEKDEISRQVQISWSDLFKNKKYSRPLSIALGIMICQQISGINAVCFIFNYYQFFLKIN